MSKRNEMVRLASLFGKLGNASHRRKVKFKRMAVDASRGIDRISFGEGEMFFTPNGGEEVYLGSFPMTVTVKKTSEAPESLTP